PNDRGSNPFSNCTLSNNILTCSGNITLSRNDIVNFSQSDLLWIINSDFVFNGNGVSINPTNVNNINIKVGDDFDARNRDNLEINANIYAANDIRVDDGFTLNGSLQAGDQITLGDGANVNGDLTSGGAINIDSGSISGACISKSGSGNYSSSCNRTTPNVSTQYCEQFNLAIPPNWTVSGTGSAGVSHNSNLYSSSPGGLYIQGGQPVVTTSDFNLSSYSSVDLSLWIRRGSDTFSPESENPEAGENLRILYFNNESTWVSLGFLPGDGSQGEIFTPTINLPTNALHNNFQIRLQQDAGTNGNWDYWHIDDLCLTPNVTIPAPVLEYRFDEASWNGTSGEVLDSSPSSFHATANAASLTSPSTDGQLCNAASFNGTNQFITSTGLDPLRTTSTLSFWIKTANGYTGNNTNYNAPAVTGIEISGSANDGFWGTIDGSGRIGVSKGDNTNGNSSSSINDGNYHHVVLSRNAVNGQVQIFIDGVLDRNGTTDAGDIGALFSYIGRSENSAYLAALIDELIIFDQILSPAEVAKIYDLQSNGLNLDGTTRSCAPPKPAVCFSDDFDRAALGSDWAVSNRSGSFGDPRIEGGRLRINDSSSNVSTAASLFRLFPSLGNKIVVEFDYFAYNGGANGGDGISLAFSDAAITPQPGGYGGSLGYAPKNSTSGFAGGWMGIGFDEYGNFLNRNDGNKDGGFSSRVRETITIRGSGAGTTGYKYITSNGQSPGSGNAPTALSPTVQTTADTAHRYRVTIDHENGSNAWVTIERDTGLGFIDIVATFDLLAQTGQAAIPEKMYLTITGSTGGARNTHEIDNLEVCANTIEPAYFIDHYELDRDYDQGLTCEPLNIAARACLNADCSTQVSEQVTTTFSPSTGWATSNIKTNYNSGDSFLFQQTNTGTYTLDILDSTPSLKPLATEKVKCFIAGAAQADCDVEFVDAAYRFFNPSLSSASTPNYTLTAGQFLNNLEVRAIETNEATGVCQTFLTNASTVNSQLGTTCSNPTTCAPSQQVSWQQSSAVNLANPQNQVGGANTTTTGVTFSSNSTAEFDLMSPDIGLQVLTVTTPNYPDVDGQPSGRTITGSVNLNVSPASLKISKVSNGSGVENDGSSAFAKAGEQFSTTLQALDINGNPVASFGRVTGLHDLLWTNSTLAGPVGGTLGAINGDSAGASSKGQWQGLDTDGNGSLDGVEFISGTGIAYSEVGHLNLIAEIDDFMGFGTNLISNTVNTGRFTPAYLQVTEVNPNTAVWGDNSAVYQGQANSLTGLTYDVVAYDLYGAVLDNYVGSYVDFASKADNLEKDASQSATGGTLSSGALNWTVTNDSDFDGSIRLTADIANVNWNRNTGGPTNADILQTIATLQLDADSFTDEDGICIRTSSTSGACAGAAIDIADSSLYFGRLTLPDQVNADDQTASVPMAIEYLSSVVGTEPVFSLQSTESFIDTSLIAGLDYTGGLCTLTGCPGTGTTTANLADGTLTSASGTGTTFLNGQGLFTINSPTSLQGMLEASAQIPNWLTWYWDGDTNNNGTLEPSELQASSTIILFGLYQGRPPILFTRPGFR
ncbi:MAG: MSHA biogenesis protein MshQ, partial [Reinekea sp.]